MSENFNNIEVVSVKGFFASSFKLQLKFVLHVFNVIKTFMYITLTTGYSVQKLYFCFSITCYLQKNH